MKDKDSSNLPVRVVVIDDHKILREIVIQVVNLIDDFAVVGQADSLSEATGLLQETNPDLVVLDLVLPDTTGLELLKQIKARYPRTRVLVFSGNLNRNLVRAVLAAGAEGIIAKASDLDELKTAIRTVGRGRSFLCAQTSEAVRLMVHSPLTDPPPVEHPPLSKREQTVLRHIAAGLNSREIAAKLGLSCYTVNNFRSKLSKKTGLHRAVQLSLYAAKIGLVGGSIDPFRKW